VPRWHGRPRVPHIILCHPALPPPFHPNATSTLPASVHRCGSRRSLSYLRLFVPSSLRWVVALLRGGGGAMRALMKPCKPCTSAFPLSQLFHHAFPKHTNIMLAYMPLPCPFLSFSDDVSRRASLHVQQHSLPPPWRALPNHWGSD
jgi:hypothetical protein